MLEGVESARRHRKLSRDGVSLYVEDHGTGKPVLLLHGWPDASHLWRNQIPFLVANGFRTIASDQRGFGNSDRPEEVAAYSVENAVADVVSILDALSVDASDIVAHDWGASVAWRTAIAHPKRVRRLVVLSVPHPLAPQTLRQRETAWYQLFFQFEGIADLVSLQPRIAPMESVLYQQQNGRAGATSSGFFQRRSGRAFRKIHFRTNILVRGLWSGITPNQHHYEEFYSKDGGKTWWPAFIATLTREREEPTSDIAAAAEPMSSAPEGHEFDFDLGSWKTHSSRLLRPLTGSTSWVDLDGVTVVKQQWAS